MVSEVSSKPGPSSHRDKLGGYGFYRTVLGSPKYVVAPMVDQSELLSLVDCKIAMANLGTEVRCTGALAFASRSHLIYGPPLRLVYTPMINDKMFCLNKGKKGYRNKFFNLLHGEEGGPADRPLIIQFCANDPEQLLESARGLQDHCDAIDLNLECPQEIARSGRYGAFLMEDWDLTYRLINTLRRELAVPVTAKLRVFPTIEKTVEYARMLMLERAVTLFPRWPPLSGDACSRF